MEITLTDVLNLFNCFVINKDQRTAQPCVLHADIGVVMDFTPTNEQSIILKEAFQTLDMHTFFTREERENSSLEYLITKQIIHYIEVYGLGMPGLFNLTTSQGTIVSMRYVKGITIDELTLKVQDLLYANAPIKDSEQVKRIIEQYDLTFNRNDIVNNELRVILYRPGMDTFTNGDDAVRYICWMATNSTLLIKSPEVIAAVVDASLPSDFFERHVLVLAQVFNRHKRIILAAKGKRTAKAINRISRLSKTQHIPIQESIVKTFVRRALIEVGFDAMMALKRATVRDKFKYLNLLAQRRVQSNIASFKIRNGKVYTRIDRPVYSEKDINRAEKIVLTSLMDDLSHLSGKTILLDENVDYGLPISRKQTIGNLPFGTKVTSHSNEISSGMYWENAWGATDLDLSTIDMKGNRVGWGQLSGYENDSITFSGDLTDATNGAMEFMTSRNQNYGLFVNIYSGEKGSKMELIVGANKTKKQWVDDIIIREKHTLSSRGSVIGFVKGKTFVVYAGRLNNTRVSGDNAIINESKADFWTLQRLFSTIGVKFDVDKDTEIEYDYDLSYSSFSFDKLENLLTA